MWAAGSSSGSALGLSMVGSGERRQQGPQCVLAQPAPGEAFADPREEFPGRERQAGVRRLREVGIETEVDGGVEQVEHAAVARFDGFAGVDE